MTEKTEKRKSGGQPGNQNARRTPFKDAFRRKAVQEAHRIEIMIEKQYAKAEEGDLAAFQTIMDRTEGKPVQATEISGPEGTPLVDGVMWGIEKSTK